MAVQLFQDIYRLTDTWPRPQMFGLITDIRRAAMGISTNLSEGQAHPGNPEFKDFVAMSQDLLRDLQGHLMAASNNPLLTATEIQPLVQQAQDLHGKLQELAASLA